MITEGYFGQIKNYPETDWLICVSRKRPWFVKREKMSHFISLAPSQELLDDYKTEAIDWEVYDRRFRLEMEESKQAMRDMAWMGIKDVHGETVRLLCWEKNLPCHRFILLDILEGLGATVQTSKESTNR